LAAIQQLTIARKVVMTKKGMWRGTWLVIGVFVVIWFMSCKSAAAQSAFCQDPGGEYIGGVYFPNDRPRIDRAGYPPCMPGDYARMYGRNQYPDGVYGPYGRQLPAGADMCRYPECAGLIGTFHAHKGVLHFRPYDETNRRMGTLEAGALGAGGGFIATRGIKNRSVAGAIIVGGAAGAGWLASRKAHDNCLVIRSQTQSASVPMSAQMPGLESEEFESEGTSVPSQPETPAGLSTLRYEVKNPWPVDAVVYYDSNLSETWIVRRKSSAWVPRREGTLMAVVAVTTNGGFKDETLVIRGDGKKFVIPAPEE